MPEAAVLHTPRGEYRLKVAAAEAAASGGLVMTLSLEHAGGLEKFAFRCIVAPGLLKRAALDDAAAASERIASWLEPRFEQVREMALKSIRSERRLAELILDEAQPGPF